MIPKIYDTQRIARIIGVDGTTNSAKIDPNQQEPVKKIVDQDGIVIEKIFNPSVGKYDVCVTTGPSYMTKRQESLEAMSQLLQGNPQLWQVAGDLFIKNMDWPGAEEMSRRFAKTIDPKLLADSDESPEMQAAKQQIEMMGKEMEQMHGMLQNVHKSIEDQTLKVKEFEASIKMYDAETKRITALQGNLSEADVQDIVMGSIHGMLSSGDLLGEMPSRDEDMMPTDEMQPPQGMPMEGMPPEGMEGMQSPEGMMPPEGMEGMQ
jgi:hypothetical protein